MQLLIVILKNKELISEILKKLVSIGVKGGTILEGQGMAKSLESNDDLPIFGMLRHLNADFESSYVMLNVVNDEQAINARRQIRQVIDLDVPNTGIMFSIPITYVEGLCE